MINSELSFQYKSHKSLHRNSCCTLNLKFYRVENKEKEKIYSLPKSHQQIPVVLYQKQIRLIAKSISETYRKRFRLFNHSVTKHLKNLNHQPGFHEKNK